MSFIFFSIPAFFLKSYICYVSASLFCMSKTEHLRNKKNVFYFTLKASLVLETIKGIQMSWRHQMPKHET